MSTIQHTASEFLCALELWIDVLKNAETQDMAASILNKNLAIVSALEFQQSVNGENYPISLLSYLCNHAQSSPKA